MSFYVFHLAKPWNHTPVDFTHLIHWLIVKMKQKGIGCLIQTLFHLRVFEIIDKIARPRAFFNTPKIYPTVYVSFQSNLSTILLNTYKQPIYTHIYTHTDNFPSYILSSSTLISSQLGFTFSLLSFSLDKLRSTQTKTPYRYI